MTQMMLPRRKTEVDWMGENPMALKTHSPPSAMVTLKRKRATRSRCTGVSASREIQAVEISEPSSRVERVGTHE